MSDDDDERADAVAMAACTGKVKYQNKHTARKAIKFLRRKRGKLMAYECEHCGGIHIGGAMNKGKNK